MNKYREGKAFPPKTMTKKNQIQGIKELENYQQVLKIKGKI